MKEKKLALTINIRNAGCLGKFDWNRIKKKITISKDKKFTDFKLIYSILYGVAGSAGLSIIPVTFSTGLPSWVIPLYILTTIFSLGVAIVLTHIDKKSQKNKKINLEEIETEMGDIEQMFE